MIAHILGRKGRKGAGRKGRISTFCNWVP